MRRGNVKKGSDKDRVVTSRRLNITTNIKKYSETSNSGPKVTMKMIYEKVSESVESPWYGSDVLYDVQTQKRGISLAQQRNQRYLLLVRKKESLKILHLVQVVVKDLNIEIKKSWDLPLLRSIDLGDDDNEFILSFDTADYSWFVSSQIERDETVWILAQMCKVMCQYDVSLGHNVDMDLLGYSTKTNGTLSRYPMLQELSNSIQIAGDVFSEEETDAEALLEELQWVAEAPGDLLATINTQSESLNLEIIDFLLQWEDDSNSSKSAASRTKDTFEVLNALSNVDAELASVDDWIGEQITRLGETQLKLALIESESGELETSYHNLSTVQQLIGTTVKSLSLTAKEETMLSSPLAVLNKIIESDSLKSTAKSLKPLLEACNKLVAGLCLNGKPLGNIAPNVWKQLLTVNAVSSQRGKLQEVSESFCRDLSDHFPKFVDALLQHSSLNDASKLRVITLKQFPSFGLLLQASLLPGNTNILPSYVDNNWLQFALSRVGNVVSPSASSETPSQEPTLPALNDSHIIGIVPNNSIFCVSGARVDDVNDALAAQSLFHTAIVAFKPLLTILFQLDSSASDGICSFYVKQQAHDRVYAALTKSLFKQFQALLPAQRTYSSPGLANLPPWRGSKVPELPLKFLHSSLFSQLSATTSSAKLGSLKKEYSINSSVGVVVGGEKGTSLNGTLFSWTALGAFLVTLGPIVKREEAFLVDLFQLDGRDIGNSLVMNALAADAEDEHNFSRTHSQSYTSLQTRQVQSAVKTHAERYLDVAFAPLQPAFIVASLLATSSAVTSTTVGGLLSSVGGAAAAVATSSAGAATGAGLLQQQSPECEGIESMAMLVVLQQYLADWLGLSFDNFTSAIDLSLLSPGQTTVVELESASSTELPITSAVVGTPSTQSPSTNAEILSGGYWVTILMGIRELLLRRVHNFLADQLAWIQAQKSDPKKSAAAVPVARYPTLVSQILEMTGNYKLTCVNRVLVYITQCTFDWINSLASQNEKYANVVRLHNFGLLAKVLVDWDIEVLRPYADIANQEFKTAQSLYIGWMTTNTFPSLSAVAKRIEGLGARVKQEELALYVRRKDVMSVVKEVDAGHLEDHLISLKKSFKKHFGAVDEDGLRLGSRVWEKLKEQVLHTVKQLESISAASFQISIGVGSTGAASAFDKIFADK